MSYAHLILTTVTYPKLNKEPFVIKIYPLNMYTFYLEQTKLLLELQQPEVLTTKLVFRNKTHLNILNTF